MGHCSGYFIFERLLDIRAVVGGCVMFMRCVSGVAFALTISVSFISSASADGLPAEPGQSVRPWVWEVGARYWYSIGQNKYDYFNDTTSTQLNSRLTYKDMQTHSGETFFRVDHRNGLFFKGFFGAGKTADGTLIDEDFPPAVAPYSSTTSALDGDLRYFTIDVGYTFFDSTQWHSGGLKDQPSHEGVRVGAFVGYNYWKEEVDAFGCTQTASNPVVCPPGLVAPTDKVITEKDTWRSLRLGLIADVMLNQRTKLSGEAAYLRTDQNALDIHYFTFGPDPANGDGDGVQVEAILSYQLTQMLDIGVGGRWWHLETDAIDSFNQLLKYDTDRYGVFVQGAYRLN